MKTVTPKPGMVVCESCKLTKGVHVLPEGLVVANPEVVVDGENGFLRPVGDVDGMAAAALSLLTDPERHRRFAAHGRQWATTRFAKAAIVARYREVYARAIAAARG